MDLRFRPGTPKDSRSIFDVFVRSIGDLTARTSSPGEENVWTDPVFVDDAWKRRAPLFDHLARTAWQFWVAERNGQIAGYARSTLRDGLLELTEFFVSPDSQSDGVGRELFARAFTAEQPHRKLILATTDIRAQARYLKGGVYPRFTVQYLYRRPEAVEMETDLVFERVPAPASAVAAAGEIDHVLFGFRRDVDHHFLLGDREGYVLRRAGQVAGYLYTGNGTGPIALLDEADFPAVLAFAERIAAEKGDDHFGLELPTVNRAAVRYLLGRGFRIEPFVVLGMSDEPFGRFENYVCTSPPFFM